MEELMLQTKCLTSDKPITYKYQDTQIEVLPYFLYEVDLCFISPRRVNLLSCRYYTSNKLLNVERSEVVKRFKNFIIERFITLLGAPMSFIKENNLPIYELNKPSKNKKS